MTLSSEACALFWPTENVNQVSIEDAEPRILLGWIKTQDLMRTQNQGL